MIDPRESDSPDIPERIDPSHLIDPQRFALEMIALRHEPELRRMIGEELGDRVWYPTEWYAFVLDVLVEVFGALGALEKLHPETGRLLNEVVRAATEPTAPEGEPS